MDNNISIREWIVKFNNGDFDKEDVKTQIEAGWYDWFCKNSALRNKTKTLGKKVIRLSKSKKIDIDNMYVFFKNCCPCIGSLYDQFSFCDIETSDVIYCIVPRSGHKHRQFRCEIWGKENDFDEPILQSNSWKDIVDFFK